MIFADEHPVYGLETPGRDGSHPLPISVEDHASSLIKTLQQKQPKGPYILIGYSSGCSVALEMAFQLEQQGEIISLLAIFDAGLVANPDYITKRSDLDWIWNMIERIEAVKGISLGLNYEQLAAQSDDQNRWYLAAEALYHHNVLPEHSTLSLLRTNLEVMKRVTLNYAAYQPNFVISAPIVLFRAQDVKEIVVQEHQAMSHYQQSDWGWQPYSNKPVQVISVPGNHGLRNSLSVFTVQADNRISSSRLAKQFGLLGGNATFSLASVFTAMIGTHIIIGIGEALITGLTISAIMASRSDLVHGWKSNETKLVIKEI